MPSYPYHCRVNEAPKESRYGGTYKRTGLIMDEALVSFVWLDGYVRSESRPEHVHDCDQTVYIIEGRLEMVLKYGGEEHPFILEQGDAMYVPGKVPHTGKLIDDEPCFLLEIFAPIRTDYLYFTQHQQEVGQAPRDQEGARMSTRADGGRVIDGVVSAF